jgi:hypothetical protein
LPSIKKRDFRLDCGVLGEQRADFSRGQLTINPMYLRHQALMTTRFFALVKMLCHATVDIDTLADIEQRSGIIVKPVHPTATGQGLNLNARTRQLEGVGKHGVIFVFQAR